MKITSCKSAVLLCVTCFLSAGWAHARLWRPDDAATPPAAWFDANDASTISVTNILGTNQVVQWNDKSLNNNHLVQNDTNLQLRTGTRNIGGANALESNSSPATNYMDLTTGIGVVDEIAAFAVFLPDRFAACIFADTGNQKLGLWSANDYGYRFGDNSTFDTGVTGASWGAGEAGVMCVYRDSSDDVYGTMHGYGPDLIENDTGDGTVWSTIPYKTYPNQSLNGALGEIVIVTSLVDTDTRQKFEGYLAWKWSLEGKLPASHPYKDAPPTVPDGTLFLFE